MFPVDFPLVDETDLRAASEKYLLSLESRPKNEWFQSSKTSKVQSLMERVIMFLLNQVIERPSQEETHFSLHTRTESAKLLWRDGQAVGFYTVKHKGSLYDSWSSSCYSMPVLDTVLVRRSWRRQGLGHKMLSDFCSSFSSEEVLGISMPLSASMVAVCRHFLYLNEAQRDRLYEVEAPGGWTQRRNIWLNIQLSRYLLTVDEVD